MQWVDRIKQIKIILIIAAVLIAVASLVVSHFLIQDLSREERNRMDIWAEAMRSLNTADETTDLNLVLKVINGNNTIPVVVVNKENEILTFRNMTIDGKDTVDYLRRQVEDMRSAGGVLRIDLDDGSNDGVDYIEICYEESIMLRRLASYPYVQLGVVLIFVVIAIFALLSSKKAEQNKVWVGLSKETAHQLGTPISSLMAWVEILKESYPDDLLLPELGKDVDRLQLIAERFSKIGSIPELKPEILLNVVQHVVDYIARRSSDKVKIVCEIQDSMLSVRINAALFEWVIENLCKNAIDAMSGKGSITIIAFEQADHIVIEISDTGRGIAKNQYKNIFTPGFTTKKRGWGLGLSLS
jgi:two-component system, sporulation sensor kinase D